MFEEPSKDAAVVLDKSVLTVLAVDNLVAVPALPGTDVGAAGSFRARFTAPVTRPFSSTVTCGTATLPPKESVAAAVGP